MLNCFWPEHPSYWLKLNPGVLLHVLGYLKHQNSSVQKVWPMFCQQTINLLGLTHNYPCQARWECHGPWWRLLMRNHKVWKCGLTAGPKVGMAQLAITGGISVNLKMGGRHLSLFVLDFLTAGGWERRLHKPSTIPIRGHTPNAFGKYARAMGGMLSLCIHVGTD